MPTTTTTTARAVGPVEQGLVPDGVVRVRLRRPLAECLAEVHAGDAGVAAAAAQASSTGIHGAVEPIRRPERR